MTEKLVSVEKLVIDHMTSSATELGQGCQMSQDSENSCGFKTTNKPLDVHGSTIKLAHLYFFKKVSLYLKISGKLNNLNLLLGNVELPAFVWGA